jgi:3-oxoacid CoA-transferase subunit A
MALTRTEMAARAARGDVHGNLAFRASARNFNPLAAMAGQVTIAQVESLVEDLHPDQIHLPGIFVDRVVPVGPVAKRIEKTTLTRPDEEAS